MAHLHSVYDTDLHFKIDAITREITNQATRKTKLMQYDHNSERFTFELPRFVDGHDMMLSNHVRVHYINAGSARQQSKDAYPVDDVQLSPSSNNTVIFSWLISQNATKYAGTLNFLIEFACVVDGIVEYAWHTEVFKGITVSSGMSNTEYIANQVSDVIAQWEQELFGLGDSEQQKLLDTSSEQQAAITAKAELALASIPADYTEVYNMADESVRTKADAILQTAAGEHIAVHDSSEDPLRGLKIFGKTAQIHTTGKNLLDPNSETLRVVGSSGVERYGYAFAGVGTYTFSCKGDNATSITCKIVSNGVYGDYKSFVLTATYTVTLGENDVLLIYRAEENQKLSSGIFNPQIEAGSVATEYEPYSGGVSAPCPDYPRPLDSVTNPTVYISGKNMLNPIGVSQTNKDVTFTNNGDGTFTVKGTSTGAVGFTLTNLSSYPLTLHKGVTYTQSVEIVSGVKSAMALVVPAVIDEFGHVSYNYFTDNQTKTAKSDFRIYSYTLYMDTGAEVDFTFRVQLEEGSTATEWEPYKEIQSMIISGVDSISGVPVASGGNYTDSDGQQWICDEVDLERGVYIQRVQKVTIDENTTYHYNTDNDFIQTNEDLAPNAATWETRILSTHFVPVGDGVTMYDTGWLQLDSGNDARFRIDGITSVDELVTWMTANGPVEFIYPLLAPVETVLSEVDIAAYKKLYSQYSDTFIHNDSKATTELSYNADTKIYLRNEAEDITASILEEISNGTY